MVFFSRITFSNIVAGEYTIYARDNGCGLSVPYTTYVLDYPRFLPQMVMDIMIFED
jgi:hypothetical protein